MEPPGEAPGDAPALGGQGDFLAPELGRGAAKPGKRAWWASLKGPIAVLLPGLEDEHPRVRRRAAEALARLGDRRATGALLQGARDRHWEVRLACLEALVRLRADGLAELLARAVRDGHPRIRLVAAEALVQHGDARGLLALDALAAYLADTAQEGDRQRISAARAALAARLG